MKFEESLDVKLGDHERPVPLPIGTYTAAVKSHEFREVSSAKGEWDVIEVQMQFLDAYDQVDEDELAAFGPVNQTVRRVSFMFSRGEEEENNRKKTMARLRSFLEKHLQVDGAESMSVREALAASVGHQCLVTVKHRPDPNSDDIVYDEIAKTMPLD